MEKKKDGMSMAERRAKGLLWVDTGENMEQQVYARGLCQDFNRTRPTETEKRDACADLISESVSAGQGEAS